MSQIEELSIFTLLLDPLNFGFRLLFNAQVPSEGHEFLRLSVWDCAMSRNVVFVLEGLLAISIPKLLLHLPIWWQRLITCNIDVLDLWNSLNCWSVGGIHSICDKVRTFLLGLCRGNRINIRIVITIFLCICRFPIIFRLMMLISVNTYIATCINNISISLISLQSGLGLTLTILVVSWIKTSTIWLGTRSRFFAEECWQLIGWNLIFLLSEGLSERSSEKIRR